jgi:hypothetical protein
MLFGSLPVRSNGYEWSQGHSTVMTYSLDAHFPAELQILVVGLGSLTTLKVKLRDRP